MWTIRFRPEIEDDLRSGSDWYSSKRDGLGDEFIDDYWDAVDAIADRPLSFAIAANGLRPCRLSRFSRDRTSILRHNQHQPPQFAAAHTK